MVAANGALVGASRSVSGGGGVKSSETPLLRELAEFSFLRPGLIILLRLCAEEERENRIESLFETEEAVSHSLLHF